MGSDPMRGGPFLQSPEPSGTRPYTQVRSARRRGRHTITLRRVPPRASALAAVALLVLSGCLDRPSLDIHATEVKTWPEAKPGLTALTASTHGAPGWVGWRLDLAPGFAAANPSQVYGVHVRFADPGDGRAHWFAATRPVELRTYRNDGTRATPATALVYRGPIAELPKDLAFDVGVDPAPTGSSPADAVGGLAWSDVPFNATFTIRFGTDPARHAALGVHGVDVAFDEAHTDLVPSEDASVNVVTGSVPHVHPGLEAFAYAHAGPLPLVGAGYESWRVRFSDGSVVESPSLPHTGRWPHDGSILGLPPTGPHREGAPFEAPLVFCTPGGTVDYEVKAANEAATVRPVVMTMAGDPLRELGLRGSCRPTAT